MRRNAGRDSRSTHETAPVELRFVDLFMIVVAALIFVVLSLSIRSFAAVAHDSPLEITTSSLPPALKSFGYDLQLATRGGKPPYGWRLQEGRLPSGVHLETATGLLSGIPDVPGSTSFTIELRDATDARATRNFELNIAARGVAGRFRVDTPIVSLSEAVSYVPYDQRLVITGGTLPYTYHADAAGLPPGLIFSSDGKISGTPDVSRSQSQSGVPWRFKVSATDATGLLLKTVVSLPVRCQDPPVWWRTIAHRLVSLLAPVAKWIVGPVLLVSLLSVGMVAIGGFRGGRASAWQGALVGPVKRILRRALR